MPAYMLSNTLSDVSGKYLMCSTPKNKPTINITVPASGAYFIDFISPPFYPNNSNYVVNSGFAQVLITYPNNNASVPWQFNMNRANSSGVPVASGGTKSFGSILNTTFVFNMSGFEPSWTGASCSDRLLLSFKYTNNTASGQPVAIEVNSVNSYAWTSVPINGSGCQILRKNPVIQFNKY